MTSQVGVARRCCGKDLFSHSPSTHFPSHQHHQQHDQAAYLVVTNERHYLEANLNLMPERVYVCVPSCMGSVGKDKAPTEDAAMVTDCKLETVWEKALFRV